MKRKKILLLSPYDAMSHRYWRQHLVAQFPDYAFTEVTLPARHFSWRFRGNSLSLSEHPALQESSYDLLIATSMTDLSALKGMRNNLCQVPSIVFFHENQFAYPQQSKQEHLVERQMTSLYTAIAADQIVFNSIYNQKSFFSGVATLLKKMPDHVPEGVVARLRNKAQVLPVPLDAQCYQTTPKSRKFSIIWNHRWEYDKGLDRLAKIVDGLLASHADFEMSIIGQQFRKVDAVMATILQRLDDAGRLKTQGFVQDRQQYLELLTSSHCVLSTAYHEFQGLSVQEAMACGCVPVVPDGLSYPEYVGPDFRYQTVSQAVTMIKQASCIDRWQDTLAGNSWQSQRHRWQNLIETTAISNC